MTAHAVSDGDGKYSAAKVFANVFISFVGAGVLGLPYAFSQVREQRPHECLRDCQTRLAHMHVCVSLSLVCICVLVYLGEHLGVFGCGCSILFLPVGHSRLWPPLAFCLAGSDVLAVWYRNRDLHHDLCVYDQVS